MNNDDKPDFSKLLEEIHIMFVNGIFPDESLKLVAEKYNMDVKELKRILELYNFHQDIWDD